MVIVAAWLAGATQVMAQAVNFDIPERLQKKVTLAGASALADAGKTVEKDGMTYVTLNNGVLMPVVGFGTLNLPKAECAQCVATAIRHGYRLIDTARNYANERQVGQGIRESGIDRSEIFVSSKLWLDDMGYEQTKAAFQATLDRMGLDYLYLIHEPYGDVLGSWRAMEELYLEGKIRAIGISNFLPDRVMDLMINSKIRPAVNQIENHPYHQQQEAVAFNQKYGIVVEAWSPLTQNRRPELFTDSVPAEIGHKYGKTPAQVVLRWHLQREVVAIPKARQERHVTENLAIFDFSLTEEEMERISRMDTGKPLMIDHRDPDRVLWFYTSAGRVARENDND